MNHPHPKQAIVIHSGGMDSSICLALAIQDHGAKNVVSMSFNYGQRHVIELQHAAKICKTWQVDHVEIPVRCLSHLTHNALMDHQQTIERHPEHAANTLVVGRNGLMTRLAAIYAAHMGAHLVYSGITEVEAHYSGYRDSSRQYMELMQQILRIDLADPTFEIRTPVVAMTKAETMQVANELGVLEFLWEETVTCYNGIKTPGCQQCPACYLRNEGAKEFFERSFKQKINL